MFYNRNIHVVADGRQLVTRYHITANTYYFETQPNQGFSV